MSTIMNEEVNMSCKAVTANAFTLLDIIFKYSTFIEKQRFIVVNLLIVVNLTLK